MLEEPEEAARRQLARLTRTLAISPACRELVKGVKISCYETELGRNGLESIDCFLREAQDLEIVRLVCIGEEGRDEKELDIGCDFGIERNIKIGYYLIESILLRDQTRLKQLVLPSQCQLDYDTFAAVFTKLPDLDNFVGSFVTYTFSDREDRPFLSTCRLRHLTICSRFEHSLFRQVVHSSFTSLTSLAFPLDSEDAPLDLSIFPNLTSLHISLRHRLPFSPTSEHFSHFVARTLRPILFSAQPLPISTFKLTTTSPTIEQHISQHRIFDLLPPTLAHLTANPLLLGPHDATFEILLNAICDRTFSRLRTITLQPSGTFDHFYREEEAKHAAKTVCQMFGIEFDVIDWEEECCMMEEVSRETWWSGSEEQERDEDSDGFSDQARSMSAVYTTEEETEEEMEEEMEEEDSGVDQSSAEEG